jgi:hypothetical protein
VSASNSELCAPVRQQALSLVLDVREGRAEALAALLGERRRGVQQALRAVKTLHFARFVVLPPSADEAGETRAVHRLAFESNFDGELGPHLRELHGALGPLLGEIFEACEGFPERPDARAFHDFAVARSLRAQAFYAGHPGLSVDIIHNDAALRRAAARYLAERQAARTLLGAERRILAGELRQHLLRVVAPAEGLYIGPVERWFPAISGGLLSAACERPLQLLAAFLLAPFFELRDRLLLRAPGLDAAELERRRTEIALNEDLLEQNALTHLVPVKPGAYRTLALELMLRLVDALGRIGVRRGRLGGAGSTHFARWILLSDRRLLFLGNYDGNSEAYLGDLVDKASKAVTMIWTNTIWFPGTRMLLWRGARDEHEFKRWARRHQLPTQIWYSAYPELSVADVLRNARLRELLAGELDASKARELLGLL